MKRDIKEMRGSIEEKYKEEKKMAYSSLHSSSNTYYG
jgi:hypothetical protein